MARINRIAYFFPALILNKRLLTSHSLLQLYASDPPFVAFVMLPASWEDPCIQVLRAYRIFFKSINSLFKTKRSPGMILNFFDLLTYGSRYGTVVGDSVCYPVIFKLPKK